MTRQLIIGDRVISDDSECYVIAEIGHNHQGSLKTAIELFKAAAECGVSAAKLQKRDNRGALHAGDVRQAVRQREQLRRHLRRASRSARVRQGRIRGAAGRVGQARAWRSSPPRSTSRAPTSWRSSTSRPTRSRPATQEHAAAEARRKIRQADDRQHRRRHASTMCSGPTTRSCRSIRGCA